MPAGASAGEHDPCRACSPPGEDFRPRRERSRGRAVLGLEPDFFEAGRPRMSGVRWSPAAWPPRSTACPSGPLPVSDGRAAAGPGRRVERISVAHAHGVNRTSDTSTPPSGDIRRSPSGSVDSNSDRPAPTRLQKGERVKKTSATASGDCRASRMSMPSMISRSLLRLAPASGVLGLPRNASSLCQGLRSIRRTPEPRSPSGVEDIGPPATRSRRKATGNKNTSTATNIPYPAPPARYRLGNFRGSRSAILHRPGPFLRSASLPARSHATPSSVRRHGKAGTETYKDVQAISNNSARVTISSRAGNKETAALPERQHRGAHPLTVRRTRRASRSRAIPVARCWRSSMRTTRPAARLEPNAPDRLGAPSQVSLCSFPREHRRAFSPGCAYVRTARRTVRQRRRPRGRPLRPGPRRHTRPCSRDTTATRRRGPDARPIRSATRQAAKSPSPANARAHRHPARCGPGYAPLVDSDLVRSGLAAHRPGSAASRASGVSSGWFRTQSRSVPPGPEMPPSSVLPDSRTPRRGRRLLDELTAAGGRSSVECDPRDVAEPSGAYLGSMPTVTSNRRQHLGRSCTPRRRPTLR